MSEIDWIKLSVKIFKDEKIQIIRNMPEGSDIVVFWIFLLVLAGETNDNGKVYLSGQITYNEETLANVTQLKISVVRLSLKTLEQLKMIRILDNGVIVITNWNKHQSTHKMALLKQQNRERQQRYYYKNKLIEAGYKINQLPKDSEELKNIYLHEVEKRPMISGDISCEKNQN